MVGESRRRWIRQILSQLVWHSLALAGAIAMLLPLVWMVSASLQTMSQVLRYPPSWIPDPFHWQSYPDVFTFLPFGLYLRNTLLVTLTVMAGDLLSNSLAAYGFARLRFPGRDFIFVVLLSTLMLPSVVHLIPLYLLFSKLHWINTLLPLIIPSFFCSPFYLFLLRQFFLTIPADLSDAAKIDGCSELGILRRIMLPLAKPVIATVAIFSFQYTWNDFMGPLIYLTDEKLRTLALGLYAFKGLPGQGTLYNQLMAASTLMVLPVLLIFALFQRYFVQGITLTGMKG